MTVAKQGLTARQAQTEQELGKMAVECVRLTQRIEELDRSIFAMQVAMQANSYALKDLDTDEAIEKAKQEAAQAAQTEQEVT